jgi:hypothetical protein
MTAAIFVQIMLLVVLLFIGIGLITLIAYAISFILRTIFSPIGVVILTFIAIIWYFTTYP